MTLNFYSNGTCRKYRKPVLQAIIERHPTRRDLALQKFQCANCGRIKTNVLSLKPGKRSPELAARRPLSRMRAAG
jgi:hypothetical protein